MMRRPTLSPALLRRLARETRAATLVEFAIVAPVFILMLMGVFDIAHTQYTKSLMYGAMQRAARDLTLENAGSRQTDIDARVRQAVAAVVPGNATIEFEKLSHFDFSDINEPEEILNSDGDKECEKAEGETFVDANESGLYEKNRGKGGIGGARDAVLYTVIVTYPRMFAMPTLGGLSKEVRLTASSVLRNQPYDEQDRSAPILDCPS